MGLNANQPAANNNRIEQPVIDVGNYPARIAQIIDLGLQAQRPYKGKEKPPANEIMLTYELVDCFMVDENGEEMEDKPRWLSETLPLHSINVEKAKSTARYNAADPDNLFNGDFSKIGGVAVNVAVVHNKNGEKIYVNVAGIGTMRAKDAAKCPELKNPPKVFDLDTPDMEIFGSLPQWVQDKIKSNLRFNGSKLQAALGGEQFEAPKKEESKPQEDVADEEAPWD